MEDIRDDFQYIKPDYDDPEVYARYAKYYTDLRKTAKKRCRSRKRAKVRLYWTLLRDGMRQCEEERDIEIEKCRRFFETYGDNH